MFPKQQQLKLVWDRSSLEPENIFLLVVLALENRSTPELDTILLMPLIIKIDLYQFFFDPM
jgi:hypothetical protein